MVLTQIEKSGSGKVRIWLNDAPAFLLYEKERAAYGLEEGQEMSEALYQEICGAVLLKRAKLRCTYLLERMDRTERQLREKLREGEYPQEVIDQAISAMKQLHFLDDQRYAESYIRSNRDKKSSRLMLLELEQKGVSRETAERALEEEPVDAAQVILKLAEKKKFDPETADEREKQRFYQFLLRKGFSFSDIKKTLT